MTTGEQDDSKGTVAMPVGIASTDQLGRAAGAPPWWHCATHGAGKLTAWGCPECTAELRRWKSTHAPRIEALEGLLHAAQMEAHAGREAVATLAGEREANALLTAEVDELRNALRDVLHGDDGLTGSEYGAVIERAERLVRRA